MYIYGQLHDILSFFVALFYCNCWISPQAVNLSAAGATPPPRVPTGWDWVIIHPETDPAVGQTDDHPQQQDSAN